MVKKGQNWDSHCLVMRTSNSFGLTEELLKMTKMLKKISLIQFWKSMQRWMMKMYSIAETSLADLCFRSNQEAVQELLGLSNIHEKDEKNSTPFELACEEDRSRRDQQQQDWIVIEMLKMDRNVLNGMDYLKEQDKLIIKVQKEFKGKTKTKKIKIDNFDNPQKVEHL